MIDFLLSNLDSILSGITALIGAISYVSYKEKKREQKLENDKREAEAQALKLENNSKIIADCYAEIERLKKVIESQDERIKQLTETNDEIIRRKDDEIHRLNVRLKEAETEIAALRQELDGMKAKRNAKGQFTKKSAQ